MTETTFQVGVLDDYQNAAREFGPWSELGDAAEVTVFTDHVADLDELVERLAPFDVVVAMRERTRFPREVLERLPRLRLLSGRNPKPAPPDPQPAVPRTPIRALADVDRWAAARARGALQIV